MSGPGCPVGAGGLIQQIRNGTPVFLFTEWNLALPGKGDPVTQDSKWCTEQIQLANGPVGMQLRIATITVGGWATLGADTKLKVDVSTVLGGKVAGVCVFFFFFSFFFLHPPLSVSFPCTQASLFPVNRKSLNCQRPLADTGVCVCR